MEWEVTHGGGERGAGGTDPEPTPPRRDRVEAQPDAPERLDELRARASERDHLADLLRRTRADFEDFQARVRREREADRRYQHGPVVTDLLDVLDNLERATDAAERAGDTGPLARGVALVRTMFLDVLRRHGVTPVEALGRPFHPDEHNAVLRATDTNRPAGTVVRVFKPGYRIHDRLLRPADVEVAMPPDPGS